MKPIHDNNTSRNYYKQLIAAVLLQPTANEFFIIAKQGCYVQTVYLNYV